MTRGLGVLGEICSHGVPMYGAGVQCIDCEIAWERMVIERAEEKLANAKKRLAELETEKKGT